MNGFGIMMTAGTGVAINTVYTIQHGHDPFPTLFAGSMWIGACVLLGTGSHDLGMALAGVYLLAVILARGPSLFHTVNALTKGSAA